MMLRTPKKRRCENRLFQRKLWQSESVLMKEVRLIKNLKTKSSTSARVSISEREIGYFYGCALVVTFYH